MVAGRSGNWYSYATTTVNQQFAVSVPNGTGWVDKSCAAWTTGGPVASGNPMPTSSDYAGIGILLDNKSPYSVQGYTGLMVALESGQLVYLRMKELNGNYFTTSIQPTTGSQTRTIPFSSLVPDSSTPATAVFDPMNVTDVQFAPTDPFAFGFAIHLVALY